MRVMTSSLLAGAALLLVLSSSAQAQYFYEGPQKPEVEVDLSILNDPSQAPTTPQSPAYQQGYQQQPLAPPPSQVGFPPPITAAVPPTPVERAPLPPIPSPYENSRVVNRMELEGSNPYMGQAAPSPFSPPALIKPPKAPVETPRTMPARVFKPTAPSALEGGAPVVVEAEPEMMAPDGVEMPAINVTSDVTNTEREAAPRTAVAPARKKTVRVQKPTRKPAVLTLAPEKEKETPQQAQAPVAPPAVAQIIPAAVVAPAPAPELSPVMQDMADIAPPPEVKKSAEMVIDDLYTLPPREVQKAQDTVELAALPADTGLPLTEDAAPPLLAPPVVAVTENITGRIAFASSNVTLDDHMHQEIDRIADLLDDSDASRLLIKGYASGTDANRAAARRLSVSRALAVRAYLMDKGIKPSRVDVRGMGSDSPDASASLDRVDLVLVP